MHTLHVIDKGLYMICMMDSCQSIKKIQITFKKEDIQIINILKYAQPHQGKYIKVHSDMYD